MYNNLTHSSTQMSPFKTVYGFPPKILFNEPSATQVQAVEEELKDWDFISKMVKENLQEAQACMKMHVDKKRTDKEF